VVGRARAGGPGRTVFVFPGQGAQWPGMGRALYAESTVRAVRVNEAMLAGLDEEQRTQLVSLLNSLLDHHKGLLDYHER